MAGVGESLPRWLLSLPFVSSRAMRDTKLDILATLFGLERGEFEPGDYEEDTDLARRIHIAARHGPTRGAIATMGVSIGDSDAAEGQQASFRPEVPVGDPAALNVQGGAVGRELPCVFCHRAGRIRAEGFAPECDDCASSWE